MSLTGWYLHKAEQCERLAKETDDPRRRAQYKEEKKRWLEIAAQIERDDEKGNV
jgi:hypothetical protein